MVTLCVFVPLYLWLAWYRWIKHPDLWRRREQSAQNGRERQDETDVSREGQRDGNELGVVGRTERENKDAATIAA